MTIEVEGLTKVFRSGPRRRRQEVVAVRDVHVSVAAGERLAFIGPNGAGKSTSIKMLTGILFPTAGTAHVLGMTPWRERRALTRRIGTLFGQRSQLWLELPPRDSLRMLGAIHGLTTSALASRIGELGELLGAADVFDVPVRSLSLGQRMRCELAACMLHRPDILFLDEPTIGLDLLAKARFRELLVRLNEDRGTTIFLTSHDVADIEHVAQRAVVINHGCVIYDDAVAAMRRTLLSTKLVEVQLDRVAPTPRLPGVTSTADGTTIQAVVDTSVQPIKGVLDAFLSTLPVTDISVTDPPLERVIAEIYAMPAR